MAFRLAGRECPVRNLNKSSKPDLEKLPHITEVVSTSDAEPVAALIPAKPQISISPQLKVNNNAVVVLTPMVEQKTVLILKYLLYYILWLHSVRNSVNNNNSNSFIFIRIK